jgi:amino-acid N-acetyltransferase
MHIIKASEERRQEIVNLLQSEGLPHADIGLLTDFYIAIEGQHLIGLIGMERYGPYGLLRSMVVHPDHRNRNIAASLIENLEQEAITSGVTILYLLTETADRYFLNKGFNAISRTDVPHVLMQSSEFSYACPSSAIVMKKSLA